MFTLLTTTIVLYIVNIFIHVHTLLTFYYMYTNNHFFDFLFPFDLLNLGNILQSGQYHFPFGTESALIFKHFKWNHSMVQSRLSHCIISPISGPLQ